MKGQSGCPGGRPTGSKTRVTKKLFERLEGEADDILATIIAAAKGGDGPSARFLLGLYVPRAKNAAVDIGTDLPSLIDAQSISDAHAAIVQAAATGRIDADSAAALSGLLAEQRRQLETVTLAQKLARLEQGNVIDVTDLPRISEPEAMGDEAA